MAGQLQFSNVRGQWRCGQEWAAGTVFVTQIKGPMGNTAAVYMCNINIDYDGSSTAYGPPGTHPQDYLVNAGPDPVKGWYGVASLTPGDAEKLRKTQGGGKRPFVDTDNADEDVKGRYPVIQQPGEPNPGYYVSAGSKARTWAYPEWDQRHWWDSNTVPFAALSGKFRDLLGVALNDVGVAIRLETNQQSGFFYKDSGHEDSFAVGEASNKIFTDLGGVGKNNYFSIIYVVFPGSRPAGPLTKDGAGIETKEEWIASMIKSQMAMLSNSSNADDLPLLLACYKQAGKGNSGLDLFNKYQSQGGSGKQPLPTFYHHAVRALRNWGYNIPAPPSPGTIPVP
jgi:hypothetical protein